VEPDHLPTVLSEVGIIAEALFETGSVLLSPQQEERRHEDEAEGEKDGVKKKHLHDRVVRQTTTTLKCRS
jgi:hypothetical protein